MTLATPDPEILADLAQVLANFQGREYSGPIDAGTRFFADLGLASIDAVVLGESLQEHYGRPLPFGDLMAELGRREDRDLTIGELAEFLGRHLGVGASGRSGTDAQD
jgi:acyl carrier protein